MWSFPIVFSTRFKVLVSSLSIQVGIEVCGRHCSWCSSLQPAHCSGECYDIYKHTLGINVKKFFAEMMIIFSMLNLKDFNLMQLTIYSLSDMCYFLLWQYYFIPVCFNGWVTERTEKYLMCMCVCIYVCREREERELWNQCLSLGLATRARHELICSQLHSASSRSPMWV